jgi:hypothetical protein
MTNLYEGKFKKYSGFSPSTKDLVIRDGCIICGSKTIIKCKDLKKIHIEKSSSKMKKKI